MIQSRLLFNILISLILAVSLVIFGVYLLRSEKKEAKAYIEEELLPKRINNVLLEIQSRYSPLITAGEAVSHMVSIENNTLNSAEAESILGALTSNPILQPVNGYDIYSAESSTMYRSSGNGIIERKIDNRTTWTQENMRDFEASRLDLLYLPSLKASYLYLHFPLRSSTEKYIGFIGFRFSYEQMKREIAEILLPRQNLLIVNKKGQIIYEQMQQPTFEGEGTGPALLSQDNTQYYLGPLNRMIGFEEESAHFISETEASFLTYYPPLNAYLIIEDDISALGRDRKGSSLLLAVIIGLAILLLNVYTIFSYQNLIVSKNRRLAELLKEKDLFLSFMSHNVNNTISVLSNDLHFALNSRKPLSFERKMVLLSWMNTTKRLITNIIFYLRGIEKGGSISKLDEVELVELLQTLLLRHREKAELKQQNLILEADSSEQIIYSNRYLLMESLDNLIDNGVKYTPLHGTVTVRLDEQPDGRKSIRISDTGPGFTEEDREKLFQPFKKGSAKPTGGEQSTGIGLYVAHKIIEKLGGELTLLDKKEEKGSVFVLTIPPT